MLGASDMVSVNIRSSLIQLATPDAMRGRVSSVAMLFVGASNELGEFESGTTAALLGTVPAVVLGGIGTLLVVAVWAKLFPPLRTVEPVQPTSSMPSSRNCRTAADSRRRGKPPRHSAIRARDSGW